MAGLELGQQCFKKRSFVHVCAAGTHVFENLLTHIAVAVARPLATGQGQAKQRQWIERVACRHAHLQPQLVCQPHDLPIGPVALGSDLGRPQLTVVFEHAGKQHRPVINAVADAL